MCIPDMLLLEQFVEPDRGAGRYAEAWINVTEVT